MRIDFRSWKNSIFGASPETRWEAARSLRSLEDPTIQRIEKVAGRIVPLFLLIWFIILVLAICVVLYLEHIGVLDGLVDNGLVPKNWTKIN
jgi:hypothetical protein